MRRDDLVNRRNRNRRKARGRARDGGREGDLLSRELVRLGGTVAVGGSSRIQSEVLRGEYF